MKYNFKIYVINLRSSIERKEAIEQSLKQAGIQYEIFAAIDGRLNKYPLDNNQTEVKMSSTEYATALSHLGVYKKLLEDNIDFALILEDDVSLDINFPSVVQNLSNNSKVWGKYELILAGYHLDNKEFKKKAVSSFWGRVQLNNSFFVSKPVMWYWGAYGYFISKNGADKLLKKYPNPQMPADYLTFGSNSFGVKVGVLQSPIIWPNEHNSVSTINERGESNTGHSFSNIDNLYHSNKWMRNCKKILKTAGLLSIYNILSTCKPVGLINKVEIFFLQAGIKKNPLKG